MKIWFLDCQITGWHAFDRDKADSHSSAVLSKRTILGKTFCGKSFVEPWTKTSPSEDKPKGASICSDCVARIVAELGS